MSLLNSKSIGKNIEFFTNYYFMNIYKLGTGNTEKF